MKKIGLVGGTGPESTVVYYQEINRIVGEKTNHAMFPELTVDSVNLYKIFPMLEAEDYDGITEYLGASVKRLANCGVDYVAFTAVTSHIVFPQVSALCPVPMISIPEATAEYAEAMGYKKVGLLGTVFTMDKDYLSRPMVERGIEVFTPSPEEKQKISDRIYHEFEFNIVKPEAVAEMIDVISRMKEEHGIEAVILGCTELPLILNDDISPVPCLDTVKIHIDKLVKLIMEE